MVKYKNWNLKSKKLKTGWKVTAVKKTEDGTHTMVQKMPFKSTQQESIRGTKRAIDYYDKL